MPVKESLCTRCATRMKTCCQKSEVYVTLGDVGRIADYVGGDGFFEFRVPSDSIYERADDDPAWAEQAFRPDGSRRVLRRTSAGDCVFLGCSGCALPVDTRPLICRLYPYLYNEHAILPQLAEGCPVDLLHPGESLLEALGMTLELALTWHAQLYRELLWEKKEASCASV